MAILGGIVLLLGLTAYMGISSPVTASNPPLYKSILGFLAILCAAGFLLWLFTQPGKLILSAAFLIVIFIFFVAKSIQRCRTGSASFCVMERPVSFPGFSAGF